MVLLLAWLLWLKSNSRVFRNSCCSSVLVESAFMPLVDFGALNDNLIKGLILCVKCLI
jgi:hypothetical protein